MTIKPESQAKPRHALDILLFILSQSDKYT